MEYQSNVTSGKHKRSSASNAPKDKRQKITTSGCPATPFQKGGVSSSIDKLAKLVEHHPLFHSRLEGMLKEPEVSAAIQKEKNEDSCLLYKV